MLVVAGGRCRAALAASGNELKYTSPSSICGIEIADWLKYANLGARDGKSKDDKTKSREQETGNRNQKYSRRSFDIPMDE